MAEHGYTVKGRHFVIVLSGVPNQFQDYTSWSAESVSENGDEVVGLDLDSVAASSESAALARVQVLIDRFVQ